MRLKAGRALILRTGLYPIKAKQFIWYREKPYKHSQQVPIALPTQHIQLKPFNHEAQQEASDSEQGKGQPQALTHQHELEKIKLQGDILGKAIAAARKQSDEPTESPA